MRLRDSVSARKTAAIAALMVLAVFVSTLPAQEMDDAYEILDNYFEASGGLERLKAERTQYFEGNISVAGMQGPIRVWAEKPDRSRAEVQIGPLNITEGDNGEVRWVLDTNGKLQVITRSDEVTLKRDEVDRRMAEYEYADRGSDVFSVALDGTEEVEGTECYVISISNTINIDRHFYYISIDGFRLEKSVALVGENSSDTYYGDYREVDGLVVAFYSREIQHATGQPQVVELTMYESNPAVDPGRFEPPEEGDKDYRFTSGDAAEDMPFRFIENHLFIPVFIDGIEHMWILDTGAGMSVIDKAFADNMGLEMEGNLKGRGAGGTVDVSFTELPPFELEGISFDAQKVAVIDMAELIRRLGVEMTGILGFDFLSRFVTKIDYANELISFYDPESFTYTGGGTRLDAHIEEGVFETAATLDGRHSGTWLFDIGAGTTHLDANYARREGYAGKNGVLKMGHGAGNEYQLKLIKAESMEFAGFALDEPDLSFSYGGTDTNFTADRLGMMGNSIFRNFIVYVDYANEQVILEKGDKFNQPWPEDHSGLSVGWTVGHGGVEVMYVSPGTPAERAGFEKGDILKSVDGRVIEPEDGPLAVRRQLREAPGTDYEIVVDRAGSEKKMRLKLADLF